MASSATTSTLTLSSSLLHQEFTPCTHPLSCKALFFSPNKTFSFHPLILHCRDRKPSLFNSAENGHSSKSIVAAAAAVAAEAEVSEDVEGLEGEESAAAAVSTAPSKPKKGKAALPLKRDRVRQFTHKALIFVCFYMNYG